MGVLSVLCVISIFIAISAVISITCWHKIRSKLRLYKSNPNYNFHRRCYILLTLQMCVPILFSMLPIGVIVVLMALNTPIGDLPQYCAMVFSFAQVLDPLFTILFIAEYKRFGIKVFRMVRYYFNCSKRHVSALPKPEVKSFMTQCCFCWYL